METKFLRRNIFQRILGLPVTAKPQDPDCWSYADGKLTLDLKKVPDWRSLVVLSVWKDEIFQNGYFWFLEKMKSFMCFEIVAPTWGTDALILFPEPRLFSVAV